MLGNKLKTYLENLSEIKFLGIKDFVIIDLGETSASIVLIKASNNILNWFKLRLPKNKVITHRECTLYDNNIFELDRELRIISENYKLKNAALLLILNKYKYFNISLTKESGESEEEISIEELLRKQLPSNLNSNEFILHFEKLSEDESFDNYLVTLTRKEDVEKYLNAIKSDAFILKLAMPSIFNLSNQKAGNKKNHSIIDFQNDKLVFTQLTSKGKIVENEYFIDPADRDRNSITANIKEIINAYEFLESEEEEKNIKLNFHLKQELVPSLSEAMQSINLEKGQSLPFEHSQNLKHQLAYQKLYTDTSLNFNIYKNFPTNQKIDIEKSITTRFVITVFSLVFFLLIILNGMNWIINNSLSDISLGKQNVKNLELQIKEATDKNDELKSDIKSLNKLKYKDEKVSDLMRIISSADIDNLLLNDLIIKKNNLNKYEIKLNGESYSKDEVIIYVKNLEGNTQLSNIELISLDRKSPPNNKSGRTEFDFQFSINMIYNDNKNS